VAIGQEAQVTHDATALRRMPDTGSTSPLRILPRLDWTLAAPPAVTFLVMLWGIPTPSYWRDESATLSAADRSLPQLVRMLGRLDAVHGFYYLLMWPVAHFIGTREFEMRLPSAVAMAAAALGIAAIGRRARSRRAGLYAGLVFAALPMVTLRGHDARPYALETAAAVLATYLLLRAAEEPSTRRFGEYGLSLVILGYLHLFGLLLMGAHALALIPAARLARARRGGAAADAGAGGPGLARRSLMLRWLVTCAAAGAAMTPLIWLGWQQRQAISWMRAPTGHDIWVLAVSLAAGTTLSALAFAALIVLGAVRADWPPAGWPGPSRLEAGPAAVPLAARAQRPERTLTWIAVPWLLLPPAALLVAAEFKPVYEFMYVEYCLPAVALLVGAGIAALGWPLRFAALGLVVALGLPAQVALRQPLAGGFIRSTAQFLAAHEKPGDAVYYPGPGGVPAWNVTYPGGFGRLRQIQLDQTSAQAGLLAGTSEPLPVIQQRLTSVRRLWIVEETNAWLKPPLRLGPDFRLALSWQRNQMRVRLYVRS
jgi:mannosyltransferase